MNEKRKGEIALLLLKNKVSKDGVRLGKSTKREIANTAKEIGISNEEALEFAELLTRELVNFVFKKKFNVVK